MKHKQLRPTRTDWEAKKSQKQSQTLLVAQQAPKSRQLLSKVQRRSALQGKQVP